MKALSGKQVARRYTLYAVFLFGVQGIVALLGATSLVIPDLPSPVSGEYGRAVHLALATFWPVIGMLGMVYYFTAEQLKTDIHSPKLARWQFAILLVTSLGLLGSLALGIGNGREYLDGLPIFYAGISLGILIGAYNLVRTLWENRQRLTPATGIMTVGVVLLCVLLIPNILHYSNPVADEAVKFWVVHLWEEMAFELTTSGFIASFFVSTGIADKKDIEKWLYLEATLSVTGGLFGTGHHYFWIGFPSIWLFLGSFFSVIQAIPVLLLAYMIYKGFKNHKVLSLKEKLAMWLILSSIFHHLTGATLLGLLMTIPWVNLYTHGTYITSGHAHLALFGTIGFLILAGAYTILSDRDNPTPKTYRYGVMGIILLNFGLIGMSSCLLIAGFLQTYLWRVLGLDFMAVSSILSPYLILRALSGSLFTLGAMILCTIIIRTWWKTRPVRRKTAN
ncbi:nitric oxide reductase large subunit [Desulfitobacterium dichloroeliminans LMG P-21439]|uniref:Nitric oxide reductase large subunit n=1 Tax=Desulfitobacterium dichloroeliminans (strain LMG P-21439 / DCA1) TaxID=871963 RepID=L0F5E9_DESDL|nr:cbb3-type cytochrome c oxidase subunit I [Desulfitobacterium dichloroeliminans]AGA69029.1 nitric oxide reductase large subunit [Desulfitobacterium dichloroeliminans LMG P-21439]